MSDTGQDDLSLGIEIGMSGEVAFHTALKAIEQEVQEEGWSLVGSELAAECDGDDTFTYTIGLHKRGLPEIITRGLCGCSRLVVCTLVERQLMARAPYEDEQITQIRGTTVRLTRWPYSAHLRLLNGFYRHFSEAPTLLMANAL